MGSKFRQEKLWRFLVTWAIWNRCHGLRECSNVRLFCLLPKFLVHFVMWDGLIKSTKYFLSYRCKERFVHTPGMWYIGTGMKEQNVVREVGEREGGRENTGCWGRVSHKAEPGNSMLEMWGREQNGRSEGPTGFCCELAQQYPPPTGSFCLVHTIFHYLHCPGKLWQSAERCGLKPILNHVSLYRYCNCSY